MGVPKIREVCEQTDKENRMVLENNRIEENEDKNTDRISQI